MVKATAGRIKSNSNRPAGKAAPRKPAAPAKAPPKKPSAKTPAKSKWVFGFGNGKAEGRADMRNLLGGKGAILQPARRWWRGAAEEHLKVEQVGRVFCGPTSSRCGGLRCA